MFSKPNANSGFWQIPLAKKSQLFTTFVTPFSHFCFNKMPFRISSALVHFQKQMSKSCLDMKVSYALVFGKDQKEHDKLSKMCFQEKPAKIPSSHH